MPKTLRPGGSFRLNRPGEPSQRKQKAVSFKGVEAEDEIIPEDSEHNPPLTPATTNTKLKKGKFDLSELDKGLEKLNQKFANKTLPSNAKGNHPPPNPAKTNEKPQKGKLEVSELDKGLEKLNLKTASKADASPSRLYAEQPWEINPSLLKIEKLLGNGSYGRVYKGTYNGEQVAIKMLEWGDPSDDEEKEISFQWNFFQEVQVMYQLESHPNICKFIGASMGSTNLHVPSPLFGRHQIQVAKQMCCIVMEFVDGGNLRDFWINHRRSGKRRMPFSVTVQFAIDIAQGLAYLHSKKICHRDLKPDNVLMDHNCNLKIADFGLSRNWPEQGEDPMSLYRGTATYCAPEVLDGKVYSHKADIYSYGMCIWELYTCDLPYTDPLQMHKGSINQKIINKNYRPKIPCGCPAVLQHIMTRCWDPNPAKRPEMREVVEWLTAINTEQPRCLTNDNAVECYACVVETTCGFHR